MWWLYLDESGDLGFDFVNSNPSNYFTVCIVATSHRHTNTAFRKAVKRTLKRKVNVGNCSRIEAELKGAGTRLAVKQYAWNLVKKEMFGVYAITLNKRRVYDRLASDKDRVYNYIARLVIDQIPFEKAEGHVVMQVDKSKGRKQIGDFDSYIRRQLAGRIPPSCGLTLEHVDSTASPGVQWADLFGWGIFRKYESLDSSWYDEFKGKIQYEQQYL